MCMTLISKVKRLSNVNYFNIFDIPGLENVRIDAKNHVCMMFTIRDTRGRTQMCLTLIFNVNHQSQVTDFRFFEILDIVNVRIDKKIKSSACIQPELRKVIQWMCVTLSSKVNRWGHVVFSNICDILNLENVRIDIRIKFVSCLQPDIRKVMQKCAVVVLWSPLMIMNPTARVRILSGGQYTMRLQSLHRACPSLHPSGVVHWVPEQLNINAVTGHANWLMVAD